MATWYVNSAATGTGAGTSWTNACTTLLNASLKAVASGDDINVLNTHSETTTGSVSLSWPTGVRILCCTGAHSPAIDTDLTTGAVCWAGSSTSGLGLSFTNASNCYYYGITFKSGNGAGGSTSIGFGNSNGQGHVFFDSCSFVLNTTATASTGFIMNPTTSWGERVICNNCTFNFGAAGQSILTNGGLFIWRNTSSAILGTTPTSLIVNNNGTSGGVILDGVDLSALGSGKTISGASNANRVMQIINCKLGASVTVASTPTMAGVVTDLINSDSSATGYRQERYTFQGTLTTSTTSYNNATDGVTPISWHVVTNTNTLRYAPFECFQIVQWAAAGTYSATVVQCTSATASLTNADVWVEAEYLGNASFPISSMVTSAPSTYLTAGSTLASGSWATSGLGNNYKLALPSFTTALAGYIRFTVKVAKTSLTINIDPAVTVA